LEETEQKYSNYYIVCGKDVINVSGILIIYYNVERQQRIQ